MKLDSKSLVKIVLILICQLARDYHLFVSNDLNFFIKFQVISFIKKRNKKWIVAVTAIASTYEKLSRGILKGDTLRDKKKHTHKKNNKQNNKNLSTIYINLSQFNV